MSDFEWLNFEYRTEEYPFSIALPRNENEFWKKIANLKEKKKNNFRKPMENEAERVYNETEHPTR